MTLSPDLAIIGSGSGNSLITPFWDDKRVTLFERDETFGGTCLNYGCIPTKMFVRAADAARNPHEAARLNITQRTTEVDWVGIRDRVFGRIDPISEAGRHYRAEELDHVELVTATATLTGSTGVAANGAEYTPTQLVIAAGSRPRIPDIPGVDLPGVHTSNTIMRLETLPQRIAIVGGGFIACEFASVFSGLGSRVTQLVRTEPLMKNMDAQISAAFTEAAKQQWEVVSDASPTAITETASGLRLATTAGVFDVDVVLLALGRIPNTDLLGAASAGFDLHDDGRLVVDQFQRVCAGGQPVEGVRAVGDICNPYQLKHVANHEARTVAHNLEHPDDLRRADTMPVVSAAFTHPELARVGLTEAQARRAHGDNVAVKVQKYGDTAYGWALEDTTGLCKVVVERSSGRVLGADVMGYQASNIIQPIVMAMSFGIDAHTAARGQYWPHPALSEVTENALLGAAEECARRV